MFRPIKHWGKWGIKDTLVNDVETDSPCLQDCRPLLTMGTGRGGRVFVKLDAPLRCYNCIIRLEVGNTSSNPQVSVLKIGVSNAL